MKEPSATHIERIRKPDWNAVWSLTIGVAGLIIAEFLPAGMLTPMALLCVNTSTTLWTIPCKQSPEQGKADLSRFVDGRTARFGRLLLTGLFGDY
jgi:hypothetical protein